MTLRIYPVGTFNVAVGRGRLSMSSLDLRLDLFTLTVDIAALVAVTATANISGFCPPALSGNFRSPHRDRQHLRFSRRQRDCP